MRAGADWRERGREGAAVAMRKGKVTEKKKWVFKVLMLWAYTTVWAEFRVHNHERKERKVCIFFYFRPF